MAQMSALTADRGHRGGRGSASHCSPSHYSLAVMIAAAIALSPVVWEDYFALAFICIALVSPALSVAWLLPLAYG
jgi:hypothetical protein